MKTSSVFVAFFLVCGLSSSVNSQTDSCSSNLNLNSQIKFDTSSLNCNPVWNAQDYILRYAQAGPNLWSFVLSAPNTNAYVAIGFSPNGNMVGSSAVVGWVAEDGVAQIKQYSLTGQSPPQVLPDQGTLEILGNSSSVVSESSRLYVAFQLSTDLPENRLLYAVGSAGVFPTAPNFRLTEHSNKVSTTLNYVTGQTQTQKSPYSNLRRSHGILNMLGWGILMPIGAIVARYFKQWDPIWFYSHISIQSLGFILGISGVICGFLLENKLSANVNKHKGLGTFILILGCLQVMAFLARPERGSKYRKYWNWYHYSVGRLLIFFAAVNVFYGIHLGNAGTGWNAGFAVVLVGLFIVAAVLEIRMWMRK
ncbi:Cytochrome b561 and DOMON domain-containing protein [Actinidia chinensis var. chinensis]|uniref:Cytochrome b561 and DOMON domain-containing protein n=1 Tax=Actinidia chinensis var. chinensis TaxID=1590841 RepID=A0A2R6QJM9_ACTCC|nr:Cytochrome b561 and DOMON domain-containing protein [Actinidia chinensis var. chinensis]